MFWYIWHSQFAVVLNSTLLKVAEIVCFEDDTILSNFLSKIFGLLSCADKKMKNISFFYQHNFQISNVSLKISQYSQENTCVGVSSFKKRDANTAASL